MTQHKSRHDDSPIDDDTLPEGDRDLTPPHGDELRSEVTFGQTDRYTNADDGEAARQQAAAEQDEEDAEE